MKKTHLKWSVWIDGKRVRIWRTTGPRARSRYKAYCAELGLVRYGHTITAAKEAMRSVIEDQLEFRLWIFLSGIVSQDRCDEIERELDAKINPVYCYRDKKEVQLEDYFAMDIPHYAHPVIASTSRMNAVKDAVAPYLLSAVELEELIKHLESEGV